MKTLAALLVPLVVLAGCSEPTEPADNAANVITPTPVATPAVDLSAFEGKYPFDKVGGTDFLHQPVVVGAIDASGAPQDVRRFILSGDGPQTPITRTGDTLAARGCEAHNCAAHDWAVLIHQDGTGAEVCHHDEDAGEPPAWYADGKREDKSEGCS